MRRSAKKVKGREMLNDYFIEKRREKENSNKMKEIEAMQKREEIPNQTCSL